MDIVILQDRFVKNVKALISQDELNISQRELARRMSVAEQYVSDYLRLKSSPGLDVISKFATALGVDPAELLAEPVHAY